jgi:hypothetical protein
VCHSSLRAAVPPRPSPTCCEDASSDSVFLSRFALMRMELLQLVDVRVEEASRPLREEVANLKLLLARIGDSLASLEACTRGGLGLVSTQASLPLDSTVPTCDDLKFDNKFEVPVM